MKISEVAHRITTKIFILFYFTFLSISSPAADLKEGINSTTDHFPMACLITSKIYPLAWTLVGNALKIGSVQKNNNTDLFSVRYVADNGSLVQDDSYDFTWLNPSLSLVTPYFTCDSFFVKKLGFDLKGSPTYIEPKILPLAQVFEAGFLDPKDAVKSIQETFSKSDDEAQKILSNSTQKIRCSLVPVMLTNLDSTPIQKDEGRYHLKIEANILKSCDETTEDIDQLTTLKTLSLKNSDEITEDTDQPEHSKDALQHDDNWVDSQAALTVAAPGYGIVIQDKPGWPVHTNNAQKIVKNNVKIPSCVNTPLYAILVLIGLNKPFSACDSKHISVGSKLDPEDTGDNNNVVFAYTKLNKQVMPSPLTEDEKNNTITEGNPELDHIRNITKPEADQVSKAVGNNKELREFMAKIVSRRHPEATPVLGAIMALANTKNINLGSLLTSFNK